MKYRILSPRIIKRLEKEVRRLEETEGLEIYAYQSVVDSFCFAHSLVESIANSANFDGDFDRLTLSVLAILFDSPFVCIWREDGEPPLCNILPEEYEYIRRGSRLDEGFAGWTKEKPQRISRVTNFSFLKEKRDKYNSAIKTIDGRKKEGESALLEKCPIIPTIWKRRLLYLDKGYIIPISPNNGDEGFLGIFLDQIPPEEETGISYEALRNREFLKVVASKENVLLFRIDDPNLLQSDLDNSNISEELTRRFKENRIPLSDDVTVVIEEKGSKWLILDEQMYTVYTVRKEEGKLNIYENAAVLQYLNSLFELDPAVGEKTFDTGFSLIEHKRHLMDIYYTDQRSNEGRLINEFERDFSKTLGFIDGAVSSLYNSLRTVHGHCNELESEHSNGFMNPVFIYGEPFAQGLSYLFTLSQMKFCRLERGIAFSKLQNLWGHLFEKPHDGIIGYVAQTGIPEHAFDFEQDLRVRVYPTDIRELEDDIMHPPGSEKIESSLVFPALFSKQGMALGGYFFSSKKQMSVSELLHYYRCICSARKALEIAIGQQEPHERELEDEQVRNWRGFSVALTHDLGNDIQCYRPYLSSFLSFLEAIQERQKALPPAVWIDFQNIMRQRLLQNVANITDEILKTVDNFMEKHYSSIERLVGNIKWAYGTNEERAELIKFLEDFATRSDKTDLNLKIENIELPSFLDSIHRRIKRWIEARSIQDEQEEQTKWLSQEFLPWPGNEITSIKGAPVLLKFILYELLKNAKKYAAWEIEGSERKVPIFWQVLPSDKGLTRFRIINDYDILRSPGPIQCKDCGSVASCYRPRYRHRMGGKWEGWRCHDHLRDEVVDTLSKCWESRVSAAGSGSGLFMISFMLEKLYHCHTNSGILKWDEDKNERVVYFEIELPDFK